MANKVIIGIVGKHYQSNNKRTDTYIRDEVKQAIFDNGGIAIGILSPNEELMYCRNNWKLFEEKLIKENIISQINLCDGIIIQGGTTNEVYESFIAKYCYDNDILV
jgi:gamma-glutamyl-gamma-aminobutyrate hydrolase PuuD